MALTDPGFGALYGQPNRPSYITDHGESVWMWRRGQRVRFYTADARQIGPEHTNVFPAVVWAHATPGWTPPEGCRP